MSGTIGVSPNMKSGVVGEFPVKSDDIIKMHGFTSSNNSYNVTSTAVITTGNGTSFTTSAQTGFFWIICQGGFMAYDAEGDLPTGTWSLYYHSDATTSGATPSGNRIDEEMTLGGYNPSVSVQGRHDLYLQYNWRERVACSPSTTYTFFFGLTLHIPYHNLSMLLSDFTVIYFTVFLALFSSCILRARPCIATTSPCLLKKGIINLCSLPAGKQHGSNLFINSPKSLV